MNTYHIKVGALLLGFCFVITIGKDDSKVSHSAPAKKALHEGLRKKPVGG